MNLDKLNAVALALVADGKGLLAMDESTPTCDARFKAAGIPQTVETRRVYREMLITTPGLARSISGVILYDETIRQSSSAGTPFLEILAKAGIIPGIKVDIGARPMAAHFGEKLTEGLDGLRERLAEYCGMGARFAKWRAVFAINDRLPSWGCIEANAQTLAIYAGLCQEVGLVPIVEPEVLMDGGHSLERCQAVTEVVLRSVFSKLQDQRVALEGLILKSNMVLPGLSCSTQNSVGEVATATVRCFLRVVPAAVPAIVFLSGGQSPELASERLSAINTIAAGFGARLPWALSFSFARAIQAPALEAWRGDVSQVPAAQRFLRERAETNRSARLGPLRSLTCELTSHPQADSQSAK